MNLLGVLEKLQISRPIFHSEADFQFALAWEIQKAYPAAEVRLEYPPENDSYRYIDILVRLDNHVYPIELKYPTKKYSQTVNRETFSLKNHGAQDLGKYDFIKDLCRIESFSKHLRHYRVGYVIWLTNDPSYWNEPSRSDVGYAAFSVHHGARKSGNMGWGASMGTGTTKGREAALTLSANYDIHWNLYSSLPGAAGLFKFVLIKVENNGDIESQEK